MGMNKLLNEIVNYLEYLNRDCGLCTTVHFSEEKLCRFSKDTFTRLLPYNVHNNPYCALVKKTNWKSCIWAQKKVIQRNCPEHCFCGTCYAGVYEYVHQICENGNVVGFVSVSGYRNQEGMNRCVDRDCWEQNLLDREPPMKTLHILIPPLVRMFELLFIYPMEESGHDDFNLILQYLNERNGQATLPELCEHFNRSKSYVSHLFNEKGNMTLRHYCNDLKLEYARKQIEATSVPITEIALNAGYNDISYFIILFREKFGMTPLQYRKHREKVSEK